MARRKIKVRRKGHWRKVPGKRKKVWVEPTTYLMEDRGKPGRTPKKDRVIKVSKKKEDRLGISFDMPTGKRRQILRKKARKDGERKVGGKLRAIQVLNKNTNPKVSRKAARDAKYIYGAFEGKKFVGKGKGFTSD